VRAGVGGRERLAEHVRRPCERLHGGPVLAVATRVLVLPNPRPRPPLRVAADVLEVALRQVHDGAALARQRRDGARARVPQLHAHGATGPGGHRRRLRLRLILLLHGVEVNARHGPGRAQQLAPRKEQTTAAKSWCGEGWS